MDSNGYIHPCGISTNLTFSKADAEGHRYEPEAIHSTAIGSLDEVKFRGFVNARKNRIYEGAPCPTCDYRGDCLPCPLLGYTGKSHRAFEICRHVFKREAEFEAPVVGGSVMIVNPKLVKITEDGEHSVEDIRTGKQFYIRGSGVELLALIPITPLSLSVSSLIDRLCEKYNMNRTRAVTRDVIDFIWWLRLLGVLDISPNAFEDDRRLLIGSCFGSPSDALSGIA